MKTPVDVLSFFTDCISYLSAQEKLAGYEVEQAEAAHAAVAELIEVTDLALGWVNGPTKAEKAMRDRIRAALARVKGEQP